MHGCLDMLGHRVPAGTNFCTNCGLVFSKKSASRIRNERERAAVRRGITSKRGRKTAVLAYAQGNRCFYCELPFNDVRFFTFDHIVPKARGGSASLLNGVAACYDCNHRKSHTPIEVYARSKRSPEVFRLRPFVAMIAMFRSC